jgi:hypothetical protein
MASRRTITAAGLAAALLAAPVSGCSMVNPPAPPFTAAPTAGAFTPERPAPTVQEGICLDPSGSTGAGFANSIRELVVAVVRGWAAPAPPVPPTAGSPPQPGLDLRIRLVSTSSYWTRSPSLSFSIPAVPGLAARPSSTEAAYSSKEPAWSAAARHVVTLAAAAHREAAAATVKITSLPLPAEGSEIVGCVSALARTMGPGPRRLVLASDLEQNQPPQLDGELQGTRVLIIQPCARDAGRCSTLRDRWSQLLRGRGAAGVTVIRPERAATDLPAFLEKS